MRVTTPARGFKSPGKYIQMKGAIDKIAIFTEEYGNNCLVLIDPFFYDSYKKKIEEMYNKAEVNVNVVKFAGEVTEKEIARVSKISIEAESTVVVGIGGGKAIDVAKGVSADINSSLIIMPTTASTDAPTSALSVIYTDGGMYSHERWYAKNPDLVLVDLDVIRKAPVRYLVSGMGDALATYFEARANDLSDSGNYFFLNEGNTGFRRTRLSMEIANSCYKVLLQEGLKAKIAAESNLCTQAFEEIVEVNILFSGLGFENTGCAGAHAIANGMTELSNGHKSLHGEKVAFGTICQLMIENRPIEEIEEVVEFCLDVGLPVTLKDLHIEESEENIQLISEKSTEGNWLCEPLLVTKDLIHDGIVQANEYVKYKKNI